MILVKGRKLDIPPSEVLVGMDGDNLVEVRQFKITRQSLFGLDFKLDIKKGSGLVGIADLDKTLEGNAIILTWSIKEEHLYPGAIAVQIRAFSTEGVEKWHSDEGGFKVGRSINATAAFPSPLPSEFEQMEQRVTAAKTETLSARDEAVQAVDDIGNIADHIDEVAGGVEETAIEVSGLADEVRANTIKVADDTALTSDNTQISQQAMNDLLAMMGEDIATLVGGKVPVSQIPLEATYETVEISDESELTTLTAEQVQRNDVAAIIEGTGTEKIMVKSFKLLGDGNPANRENWVRVAVEYASISAYATTADYAEDTAKINGHRVVYMSQEQYDNAVKDPETVYMVGVE